GHRDRTRHGARELEIVAVARAVPIHAREENLSRSELLHLARPPHAICPRAPLHPPPSPPPALRPPALHPPALHPPALHQWPPRCTGCRTAGRLPGSARGGRGRPC